MPVVRRNPASLRKYQYRNQRGDNGFSLDVVSRYGEIIMYTYKPKYERKYSGNMVVTFTKDSDATVDDPFTVTDKVRDLILLYVKNYAQKFKRSTRHRIIVTVSISELIRSDDNGFNYNGPLPITFRVELRRSKGTEEYEYL